MIRKVVGSECRYNDQVQVFLSYPHARAPLEVLLKRDKWLHLKYIQMESSGSVILSYNLLTRDKRMPRFGLT